MPWEKRYEIGIPIIDTQHQQLFRFSEELQAGLNSGLKASVIKNLLINVEQYVARHFAMEEKFMTESNYPGIDGQLEAHAAFSKHFEQFLSEFNETGLTPPLVNSMKSELINWISEHITGLDQEFGRYYRDQQTQNESSDTKN
jgi:hemerythrin